MEFPTFGSAKLPIDGLLLRTSDPCEMDLHRVDSGNMDPVETKNEGMEPQTYRATDAKPGSSEKIRVMVQRVESGLPLWHPQDNTEVPLPPRDGDTSEVSG